MENKKKELDKKRRKAAEEAKKRRIELMGKCESQPCHADCLRWCNNK